MSATFKYLRAELHATMEDCPDGHGYAAQRYGISHHLEFPEPGGELHGT